MNDATEMPDTVVLAKHSRAIYLTSGEATEARKCVKNVNK
jgi:hypothetical protein